MAHNEIDFHFILHGILLYKGHVRFHVTLVKTFVSNDEI